MVTRPIIGDPTSSQRGITTKEARKQQEIDEARDRLEQIRQRGNAEYERALKSMASSDDKSLVHYVFSQWHDVLRESVRQRDFAHSRSMKGSRGTHEHSGAPSLDNV